MTPPRKVWVKSFGCRVNQAEGDALTGAFLAGGATGAEGFEDADLCVVNTCTVTGEADREALALLRRVTRRNPAARLVVTGCLATRDPERVRDAAPAALIVGGADKASIPAAFGCAPLPPEAAWTPAGGRARAFLKVQDGCNMDCAYCTIPAIRPTLSSVPLPELLARARAAVDAGVPELVLCGIRLGRYLWREPGEPRVDLGGLVARLLELPGDFRVRLSSLEVTDATDRLFALMAASGGRLCPHLHLPLQSGCDAVLRRMRRWYSADLYRRRVDAYRAAVPGGALFADVISGFAGETEAEHAESLRFAEALAFDGLHPFRYSPRPGTAAASAKAPPAGVVAARAADWRALDAARRAAHARRAVGTTRTLAPALDGREGVSEDFLTVAVGAPLGRGLTRVRVTAADGARLAGAAA
ncbi:MAG: MiaB/RimO family radical SAM methylthiotransferase [Elusimicrobia bacterium]|nr:MiaB/RimO family radical SAM methylthiotransferase [Elusimicrobiota bacterium]